MVSKVSIVLPVFNAGKYLTEAIESVLSQTYKNWELLISDNCSTDDSLKIAQQFAENDSRILVHSNESHVNACTNYNLCVSRATGDYIELFGADDIFESACLDKLVGILDSDNTLVLATSARNYIDENGALISESRPRNVTGRVRGKDVIDANLSKLQNWIGSPVMFRASLRGKGFDNSFKLYFDIDYWIGMLQHGDLFYVDEILFNYRLHPKQETTRTLESLEYALDIIRLGDKYFFSNDEVFDAELQNVGSKTVMDALLAMTLHAKSTGQSFAGILQSKDISLDSKGPLIGDEELELRRACNDYRRVACLALLQLTHMPAGFKSLEELVQSYSKIMDENAKLGDWNSHLLAKRDALKKELESAKFTSLTQEEKQDHLEVELRSAQLKLSNLQAEMDAILKSSSWRLTRPLRMLKSQKQ